MTKTKKTLRTDQMPAFAKYVITDKNGNEAFIPAVPLSIENNQMNVQEDKRIYRIPFLGFEFDDNWRDSLIEIVDAKPQFVGVDLASRTDTTSVLFVGNPWHEIKQLEECNKRIINQRKELRRLNDVNKNASARIDELKKENKVIRSCFDDVHDLLDAVTKVCSS